MKKDLFELGKKSRSIFTPISNDCCLVKKTMPIEDERLEEFVSRIREAREAGINIAEVIDYQLIPETTRSYGKGVIHYSDGVFLERRAPGESNEDIYIDIKTTDDKDNDIANAANFYIIQLINYVRKMIERASLPQSVFDKFVSDCIRLEEFGIIIDPKSTNFFIDKEEGVTIIDPIPLNDEIGVAKSPCFPFYIMAAIYGFGRPQLFINGIDYSVVTPVLKDGLISAYAQLDSKISLALRRANINEDLIRKTLGERVDKYVFRRVTSEDMLSYIIDGYFAELEKEPQEKRTSIEDGEITIKV